MNSTTTIPQNTTPFPKDDISTNQITVLSDQPTERYELSPPVSLYKTKIISLLESSFTTITLNIATIYALFGDDIKTLGFPKSADDIFSSLVVICLFLFLSDLILSFLFKVEYRWSFYFWLDLLATLSLVTDIGWVWDAAIGVSNGSSSEESVKSAQIASNAGAKTANPLRIIRIVRLIRIVKLYKNAKIALKKRENHKEFQEIFGDIPHANESRVGKAMSETVMQRVIVIVLTLLFMSPLFDTTFYTQPLTSWDFGLEELSSFAPLSGFESVRDEYLTYHQGGLRPIVYLSYTNKTYQYTWQSPSGYSVLRYNELHVSNIGSFISIFDLRYDAKITALLNICMTVYICIVLTLGAVYFTKDSEVLIIKPIEKMIEKVRIIAKNPIAAGEIQAMLHGHQDLVQPTCCKFSCVGQMEDSDFETNFLENTILKIGVLLALGFGEAGSIIIGSNIEKGGEVDPMAGGAKVIAIYGFCDIRNFTDTTEELQEEVMMFVNEIAQVVHGIIDKYLGAANKNIGDAFLLVWKFGMDEMFLDCDSCIVRNPQSSRAHYLPDMSLLSFLKILAKVNKDPDMLKYRTHTKLISRMPGYEIKMGFGLHLGWAIEGAIGSLFKIDASYLSPNVNVASALEGSTKMYGVPLLISETLYKFFSSPVQKFCRQVDRVLIRGHSEPLNIYTSDCDFSEFPKGGYVDRSKKYFRHKRKMIKKDLESGKICSAEMFSASKEFNLMRRPFDEKFFRNFSKGVVDYVSGDWLSSKVYLVKTLRIREKDGPALSLLSYMSEFDYVAPEGWKGFRFNN